MLILIPADTWPPATISHLVQSAAPRLACCHSSLLTRCHRLRPLLTKSITSGVISCAGSCIAQLATQPQGVSVNVARAFLVYGGLVTGPVTHYFYILLDKAFPGSGIASRILRVLTDRLIFSPAFLLLTLYLLDRLKGSSHANARESVRSSYWNALLANWKIWTIPQIVNINLVAPQYRVLFANMVALVWNSYLASIKK